ncbi:MAG: NAD-dependent epimerase/dehydratase family protein [Thermoplasmatota archaeon]
MTGSGVLVTGGAGFIGSHLVDLLISKGHVVYVLDDLSSGTLDNLASVMDEPNFKFIRGDIRNPIEDSVNPSSMGGGPGIEAVFHLGARVDVTTSMEDPMGDAAVNYIGTINVLNFALKKGVRSVIYSSSAAVYGDTADIPVRETAPKHPLSPYGLHKLSSERMMDIFSDVYGMSCSSLRFFNVYGPRQDSNSPYAGVISLFLDKAGKGDPLLIYGDGSQTRDFIHVSDISAALYTAYVDNLKGVYNVGTGVETSLLDLADMLDRISGRKLRRIFMPARKGEIERSVASIDKLRVAAGFSPGIELLQGLKDTYRHRS